MMSLRYSIFPFLLIATVSSGQQVLIAPGADDPSLLTFEPAFIQRNRITSVQGQAHVKREREPMVPRSEFHTYRFDGDGLTVYANHSYGQPGSGHDTTSTILVHDASGRLMKRIRNDASGHYSLTLEYDREGRPVREVHERLEGPDGPPISEISDERFTYETINDTTWKKTTVNNLGLPYLEQRFAKDHLGYLREVTDRYLISDRRSRITFTYDEKGRLAERVEQPDIRQPANVRHTWTYDQAGNVMTGDVYRGERHVTHEEFLYDEGTMFLKATLRKDLDSGTIFVMRYSTERR